MLKTREQIAYTLKLLGMEYEEDLRQFREVVLETPLEVRQKKGITWYPVDLTKEKVGLRDHLEVDIERTGDPDKKHNFQVGSVASLFLNDGNAKNPPHITGVIKKVKDNTIRVVFSDSELPDWVYDRKGRLGLDLYFDERTYREMQFALNKVHDAENNRLSALREILLGSGTPKFSDEKLEFEYPNLNESQNAAIQRVMQAEDVAIIHGPPGTGKTTTLVQAIRHTLRSEKQVLVCAPSNSAVDLLTERLGREGVDVTRIGHPARVSEDLQKHTLDFRITQHLGYPELKKYKREADQLREKALKFKRNFGKEERRFRREMLKESGMLKRQVRMLEDFILKDTLDKSQVICATLTGASSKILSKRYYQTVFIDEAAQALEPGCWIPLLKADRVIFAGDHCQLPPTIKSFEAARKGLEKTLFEKAIGHHPEAAVLLQTQYRMTEEIMQFSSNQFYEGKLEAHDSVAKAYLCQPLADEKLARPVSFVDTAGCGFDEKYNPESRSRSNPEEGRLLLKLLEGMAEAIDRQGMDWPTVAIISPYKEQVRFLRKEIRKHDPLQDWLPKIVINTVDAFQGRERQIVCISLVRSNEKGEIGFLGDIRRMNVAMTRAQQKLVVVGDSATLGNHAFYQDFLSYVETVEGYQSAWEYLY